MSLEKNKLAELLARAHALPGAERDGFFREIVDILLSAPNDQSSAQAERLGEIMGGIVANLDLAARRELACRVAKLANAPHGLVVRMANDAIDIAEPLLVSSPVLTDADLIVIVGKQSAPHLAAIARRTVLNMAVTDVLLTNTDDQLSESLVMNSGARFSRGAWQGIIARAAGSESLQEAVLDRPDLPIELMQAMFFFVSPSRKTMILKRTEALDQDAMTSVHGDMTPASSHEMHENEPDGPSSNDTTPDGDVQKTRDEQSLISLLRAGKTHEFAALFARLVAIDGETAEQILHDTSGQALAIACRAAALHRATFSSIILLACDRASVSHRETCDRLRVYDHITAQTAARVITLWRACPKGFFDDAPIARPVSRIALAAGAVE